MKKISLLLLILPLLMFGQEIEFSKNFKIHTGEPYKVIDAKNKTYFTNSVGDVISVKTRKEEVFIQKFDNESQNEISRKEYKDFPKYTKVQKVVKFGDRLFYFYAVYNKKEKNESVYVREVDMDKAVFEKAEFLFKTSGVALPQSTSEEVNFFGFSAGAKFEFYTSFNNSKIMIQYRVKPLSKRDKINHDILGFYIFDSEDMTKKWGKEIKMPYTEKVMNNITYTVSNEGNAFMIAYLNETKTYELLSINSSTSSVETHKIKLSDARFFKKLTILENVDGNFNCLGYYANGIEYKYNPWGNSSFVMNVNGFSYFTISNDGNVISENKVEFPVEMINQFEKARKQRKNTKREAKGKLGIQDLVLREVKEMKDGSRIIIGEQYFLENNYNYMTKKNEIYFYYEDVVITKLSEGGDVIWMKKLPKSQVGKLGRGGMSIKYVKSGGSHYILFLDNEKNLTLGLNDAPKKHSDGKGGFLTAYKIDDKSGEVEKLSILDTRDLNGYNAYQFKTSRLLMGNENQLFLEVYIKGKKDVLVKIELDK